MRQQGFTLIEMIIVVAIIAVMAAAAIPAINAVSGANARATAGEIAGACRWLYDTAALRHQTCRLAFDMDHGQWWAECTKDRFYLSKEAERSHDGAADVEEDDDELARRFPDERDAEKRRLLAKAKFGEFSDEQVRKKDLPSGARVTDVWAQHQRDPYSKGMAYVYFYPEGLAELAHIPVTDGDNYYTVVVSPLTGHAKVVNGKPEVPHP